MNIAPPRLVALLLINLIPSRTKWFPSAYIAPPYSDAWFLSKIQSSIVQEEPLA